ncbi:hypothetical protein D3C87_1248680 [compost metagenome]
MPARHRAGLDHLSGQHRELPEEAVAKEEICGGGALLRDARPGAADPLPGYRVEPGAMGAVA